MSSHLLKFPKEGDSITPMGNLCQCSITHTVKKQFLMFRWNILGSSLCTLPLVLSLDTNEMSLAPFTDKSHYYSSNPPALRLQNGSGGVQQPFVSWARNQGPFPQGRQKAAGWRQRNTPPDVSNCTDFMTHRDLLCHLL